MYMKTAAYMGHGGRTGRHEDEVITADAIPSGCKATALIVKSGHQDALVHWGTTRTIFRFRARIARTAVPIAAKSARKG
jgi:hypothetical protein